MQNSRLSIRQQLSRISPLSITFIFLFAAAMTYFLIRSFAASGTATLYTSPGGTQAVTVGQTFTINVRISSGATVPVTGASVYLSYPTDKLQTQGEGYTGSPYTTQLIATDSGGILRMDRAAFPAISGGDQLFAQVTFKTIAAGSAPISFGSNSIVTSGEDDSNILTQKTGVTYNIAAPSTSAPTPPSSNPSTPVTSSGGSSGSPSSSGSSSQSTTTQPKTGSNSTADNGAAASGGSSGTPAASNPDTATTTGSSETPDDSGASTVQVTILDSQNKPVQGAEVTVDGQKAKTDKNGVARFTSVNAGKQTLAVTYNGKKTAKIVQVKNASSQSSPQLFNVSITKDKFNPTLLVIPVIVLFGAGVFFLRPPGMKFAKAPAAPSPGIVSSGRPPEATPKPGYRSLDAPGTVYEPHPPADTPSSLPGSTTEHHE